MTDITVANRIVASLSAWVSARPGARSIDLRETPEGGWRATMHESRTCSGSSALDALSQIAVVASVENEEQAG